MGVFYFLISLFFYAKILAVCSDQALCSTTAQFLIMSTEVMSTGLESNSRTFPTRMCCTWAQTKIFKNTKRNTEEQNKDNKWKSCLHWGPIQSGNSFLGSSSQVLWWADTVLKEEKKDLKVEARLILGLGPLIHFHKIWKYYRYFTSVNGALS